MLPFIDIPGIHLLYTITSVLLISVLTRLVLYVSQHMMRTAVSTWKVTLVSLGTGLSAVLATYSFTLSIDAGPAPQATWLFFVINFLLSSVSGALILRVVRSPIGNTRHDLLISLLLAALIYFLHMLTPFSLYPDFLDVHLVEVLTSMVLTQSTIFTLFRFLNMYTNGEEMKWSKMLLLFGSLMSGIAIVGLGYSIFAAFTSYDSTVSHSLHFLIPTSVVLISNTILTVIPLLYRNRALVTTHQLYQSLFNDNPNAVMAIEKNGSIQHANKESGFLTGYNEDAIKRMDAAALFLDKETFQDHLNILMNGGSHQWDTKIVNISGVQIDVHVTGIPTIVKHHIVGYFLVIKDISHTIETAKQVEFLAYHDDLTKLPNRRLMQQQMQEYAEKGTSFSILLIDYDLFKRINDIFGHSFGDKVLVETAARLERILDGKGTVNRVGGDEFLLIVPGETETLLAQYIVEQFRQPIRLQDYEHVLQASIGIASFPEHAEDMDNLYKYADIAMYQTKENGGNNYTVFQPEMAEKQVLRFEIEHELQKAIETQAFDLYFQPKFHSFTRTITGAEVLLRWNHPERGFIPPNVFIPIAEESGLIVAIERSVIERVMACLSKWRKETAECNIPCISINVSVITFLQDDFSSFFRDRLEHYNLNGSLLELEITERVVMQNETKINSILQKLRETGVKISIDDFGTGYSSLNYLDKLQVDILKIDQTFIQHIEYNQSIVATIQSLAENLKLHTIAEGVETEAQLQALQGLGCTEVQGYLFSKPLPQADFESAYIMHVPADA
ncbi:putative bifunctional diguanylate cyclase/phosphodiesterase [Terribacillus saccharophilus]|uniref:putative bifunctional diguanylate cyclase/phosphodiesterase n=1 Tax=Terribacillus saccharophilus TaxID=361277 RepID=UPI002989EA23|nr:EAL domain-containing protein [Terribacillus saccharophilus]MCM3225564.1 EAL domain-containing protein [Terribacillus saccharophilus]MEC0281719.1 EAL domain-containing protein [Terribacillus saccharophilus]MEC0291493.1 EAL domain-containing protein [Terribacillus saccharophilus]